MSVAMSNNEAPSSDNSASGGDEKWRETYKKIAANYVPYDPRYPNQNQTRNCQQNYIDYYRCLNRRNGDEAYCAWYKNAYKQLCPPEWYEKWDEQREEGIFPVSLD